MTNTDRRQVLIVSRTYCHTSRDTRNINIMSSKSGSRRIQWLSSSEWTSHVQSKRISRERRSLNTSLTCTPGFSLGPQQQLNTWTIA